MQKLLIANNFFLLHLIGVFRFPIFFLEWIGVVYVLPNTGIEVFTVFPYTFVCFFVFRPFVCLFSIAAASLGM